jgi:hypothetical protein
MPLYPLLETEPESLLRVGSDLEYSRHKLDSERILVLLVPTTIMASAASQYNNADLEVSVSMRFAFLGYANPANHS